MRTANGCIAHLATIALCGFFQPMVHASECDADSYFSASDARNATPLTKPSLEFLTMRRQANSGGAAAQRSMGVAYETGYLVSRCEDKALYWCRKAGKSGDKIAQDWVANHARFENLRRGPECIGATCFDAQSTGPQSLSLVADPNSHFFAPVVINGVTVSGMIDTGATLISMSDQVAKQMGVSYLHGEKATFMTANGSKSGYVVTLDAVTVGNLTLREVKVAVSDGSMPVLIGMSFLKRVNMDIRGSNMTLSTR